MNVKGVDRSESGPPTNCSKNFQRLTIPELIKEIATCHLTNCELIGVMITGSQPTHVVIAPPPQMAEIQTHMYLDTEFKESDVIIRGYGCVGTTLNFTFNVSTDVHMVP